MRAALLLALLLPVPALAAPPAPLPQAAVEPLTVAVAVPGPLTVGVPVELPLVVRSGGLGNTGAAPPVAREVDVLAALDGPEAVQAHPHPLVLPADGLEARGALRVTPARLGPRTLEVHASGALLPGNASLVQPFEVVRDTLSVEGLHAGLSDADLDLPLQATLRSGRLADEPLAWRVEAAHAPRNGTGTLRWTAALGDAAASPAGTPWSSSVRARYGPGNYTFTLVAEGERLQGAQAAIAVQVPEVRRDEASAAFTVTVADAPTTLRLASDGVNADGKAKAPGAALITRVVVGDANGLGDVQRVTFTYARNDGGVLVPVDVHVVEGLGSGAEVLVEDRFDTAPMKDGAYECTVTAEGTGAPSVRRTYVITDAPPEADLALARASVRPDRALRLEGTLRVRDGNLGTGPLDGTDVTALGTLQLFLYKGSVRVGEAGWGVAAGSSEGPAPLLLDLAAEGTRSSRFPYAAADGQGQLTVPVAVLVPEGAAAGSYRLSVAANATLASASFEVQPLPRVTRLVPAEGLPGAEVAVEVEASEAPGLEALELRAPWGAVLRASAAELPRANGSLRWTPRLALPSPLDDDAPLELVAVADLGDGRVVLNPLGQPANARAAALKVANAPPRLDASLRLGGVDVGEEAWLHPHAAAELEAVLRAQDANAAAPDLKDELAPLQVEVRDWRGEPAPFDLTGARDPAGSTLAVAPRDAPAGRYTLTAQARDDDGVAAEQQLRIQVGAHFRLALAAPAEGLVLAPDAAGRLAAGAEVRNKGNTPAGALAVLAEGLPPDAGASVALALANGTILERPLEQGYARFEAPVLLAPGAAADLRLLVDGRVGVPAGTFRGRLLVAGEAA